MRRPIRRGPKATQATICFDIKHDAYQAPDWVWQQLLDGKHPVAVWRRFRVVTRDELAQAAQVDRHVIYDLERDKIIPQPDLMQRIAEALQVPPLALERKVLSRTRNQ